MVPCLLLSRQPSVPDADDGLGAIGDLELGEVVAGVVGDGCGEEEVAGDDLIVLPLGDEGEDFPLALGEIGEERRGGRASEEGEDAGGDGGTKDGLSGGHRADSAQQVGLVGAPEHVAAGARAKGGEDRIVVLGSTCGYPDNMR